MLNVGMRPSALNPRLGFGTTITIDDDRPDLTIDMKKDNRGRTPISGRGEYKVFCKQKKKELGDPFYVYRETLVNRKDCTARTLEKVYNTGIKRYAKSTSRD